MLRKAALRAHTAWCCASVQPRDNGTELHPRPGPHQGWLTADAAASESTREDMDSDIPAEAPGVAGVLTTLSRTAMTFKVPLREKTER